MLWTIAVILIVLWALGLASAYTLSGFIHILLVLAIVVVLIRVIQGRRIVLSLFLVTSAVLASRVALAQPPSGQQSQFGQSPFGQYETQMRARQLPGWDARTREGRCEIRVWVDNRAEVRMRGDAIFVRTLEGARGRDEGSTCSQPLPYNSVRGFQIRQTAGRNRVELAQEPSRMNNYTAMIAINDLQGGGDNYAFEVTWQAEPDVSSAPAPFFDDVRACQDTVRQRFLSQNGRGSYIDFNGFADRTGQDQDRGQGQGRDMGRFQSRNRSGQESIQGQGIARKWNESREITYSCVIDMRQSQVMSGIYQYSGGGMRMDERSNDRRPLR